MQLSAYDEVRDRTVNIVHLFGQDGYGHSSRQTDYKAMRTAMVGLRGFAETAGGNVKIAMPLKIGCGLAGGEWSLVLSIIQDVFDKYPGEIELWSLDGTGDYSQHS